MKVNMRQKCRLNILPLQQRKLFSFPEKKLIVWHLICCLSISTVVSRYFSNSPTGEITTKVKLWFWGYWLLSVISWKTKQLYLLLHFYARWPHNKTNSLTFVEGTLRRASFSNAKLSLYPSVYRNDT